MRDHGTRKRDNRALSAEAFDRECSWAVYGVSCERVGVSCAFSTTLDVRGPAGTGFQNRMRCPYTDHDCLPQSSHPASVCAHEPIEIIKMMVFVCSEWCVGCWPLPTAYRLSCGRKTLSHKVETSVTSLLKPTSLLIATLVFSRCVDEEAESEDGRCQVLCSAAANLS